MKKIKLLILTMALMLSSCADLFEPAIENFKNIEQMYTDASYAQGFLVNVYRNIPAYYDNSDYATDDAVTNQKSNNYLKMATGTWTASNNPMNMWVTGYGSIQYINLFLENADKVKWAEDEEANALFNMRMKGEAHGMRALFMYYLLRNHSGFTADGRLMGVPILDQFQDLKSDFNMPRNTFEECLQQVYADLDRAEEYLPAEYNNITDNSAIPTRFQSITQNKDVYNRVMGEYARQLFNGLIAKSIRVRVSLLAASPAFQDASNTTTWADAANAAAKVIDYQGGINNMDPKGFKYYADSLVIDGLKEGLNPKEIIWRENLSTNNTTQEAQNFPPMVYGTGYMNPTQNLVDAFPMANGYPITDITNSGYNANTPYAKRDPRFDAYIIYNGSRAGVSKRIINTSLQSPDNDGINKVDQSTRTGYYMKKRLRMDVNPDPNSTTGKTHYTPRIRYTEMYLAYAEAANEAWGPKGTGSNSYSAYDVIKAIRKRAGVGGTNDPYLEACAADKTLMSKLIRNERRLELCFESFRFWDLRRWKESLTETARGMLISDNTYTVIDVETRTYADHMYYAPIPYSELLKYNNLVQNKGWN